MDGLNYFLAGQLWQYDHRPCDERSVLTVLAVEEAEDDTIVHVRLDNINFGSNGYIEHLAFSADALMGSVTAFIKHLEEIPDFKDGYEYWKQAYNTGRTSYWKKPVKEAVESIGMSARKE